MADKGKVVPWVIVPLALLLLAAMLTAVLCLSARNCRSPFRWRDELLPVGTPPIGLGFLREFISLLLSQTAALGEFFQSEPIHKCIKLLRRDCIPGYRHPHAALC